MGRGGSASVGSYRSAFLARVAAHTQERRFAPLSCFMAGVASERLRAAKGGLDDAAVAEFILEVRQELEKEYPAGLSER